MAKDVAKIFTRLFPKRTEPISLSLSSVISRARCAPREPLSAWLRNFPREAAVSAVSEPEKKLDNTNKHMIVPAVIQKATLKIEFGSSISDLSFGLYSVMRV